MPAKLREDMGEKFIITKGLDGCLFGFSQNEWENFETKLKTLPLTNKNARDFVRFFLSGAMECEIDKQGRFLISSNLRNVATLEKEVVIIGVGTRIEIWNKDKWEEYNSEENISADDIAENSHSQLSSGLSRPHQELSSHYRKLPANGRTIQDFSPQYCRL